METIRAIPKPCRAYCSNLLANQERMFSQAMNESLYFIEHLRREIRIAVPKQTIDQHENVAETKGLALSLRQNFLRYSYSLAEVPELP